MQGIATVKAVLSGDTVVVMGSAKPGSPPPELQLSLSHVMAPRATRHPDQRDEPFGWPAREFLRASTIGKQVRFRVDHKVEKTQRTFATLWLLEAPTESINKHVVRAGWARVTPADATKPANDEYDTLVALGKEAEEAGVGMHNKTPGLGDSTIRDITWSLTPAEAAEAATALSASPQPAIVEQVINGSLVRVLLTATAPPLAILVNMAGVACPKVPPPGSIILGAEASAPAPEASTAAVAPAPTPAPAASVTKPASAWATRASGGAGVAAPTTTTTTPAPAPATGGKASGGGAPVTVDAATAAIAAEAKLFTEVRLLHRDVTLIFGPVDKYTNFQVRIEHPSGDIQVELLKAGLAKIVDWSISAAPTAVIPAMRSAERAAKLARLKLWCNYVPVEIKGERFYEGKVVEVVSGDTLIVAVPRADSTIPEERRVTLSSVRAPRLGRRDEADAPWAAEAKEALRRMVIGRDVQVSVDYTRTFGGAGAGDSTERINTYATVTYTSKKGDATNVALALAEDGAKAAKRNIHSGKEPATKRINDVSSDAAKAKTLFPFLQRAKTMRGVVEFVIPGGRLRLTIPSELSTILFAMAGIRLPSTARPAGKGPDGKPRPGRAGEPFGAEAFAFLRENVMQQEVEVEAEEVDKNGVIHGPVWVGKGGARRNLVEELLARGLAYCSPAVARMRDGAALQAVEATAKAAKAGLWATWVDKAREEEDGEGEGLEAATAGLSVADAAGGAGVPSTTTTTTTPAIPGTTGCVVSEIVDGGQFYIQADGDRKQLDLVTAKLQALWDEVGAQSGMVDTKRGKLVACLFQEPGQSWKWFRARIEGPAKSEAGAPARSEAGLDKYNVTYVDYGNKDEVTVQRMRPLDATLAAVPPLAKECSLAMIRVPKLSADFGVEAAGFVSDAVFGRHVGMKSHGRDPATNVQLVSLWDTTSGACLNEELVAVGLARVARTEAKRIRRRAGGSGDKDADLLALVEAAQGVAKTKRAGLFRYGEPGDSDDERR